MADEAGVHLRAIADRAGLPFSTVQREVERLEDAGIVRSQRFAQARVVRPNEASPFVAELRSLLLKTYGPVSVLEEALEGVPGVRAAYLFGSWAARYHAEPGPLPGDVDVLVVVTEEVDPDRVYDACAAAADALGHDVQPTIVDQSKWRDPDSAFLRTVRDRPLVELAVGGG